MHALTHTIPAANVPSDLTDYISLADTADWYLVVSFSGTAANGGGDIRIFESDGVTELAREVVSYDSSTGVGEVWFKIPFLSSSTDNVFQIHVDGVSADYAVTATYGRNAVWSDYVGVWHLQENFPGTAVDSTGNGYDMDQDQGTPGDSTSMLGKGMAVGANEHIYRDFIPELNGIGTFTVSGWLKLTGTFNNERAIFGNRTTSGSPDRGFTLYADYNIGGNSNTVLLSNGGASSAIAPSNSIVVGQEHLIHGTFEGGSATGQKIYVDGSLEATADASGLSSTLNNNSQTSIGGLRTNARDVVPADLDEVRITTVLRSADWISTEHANQNSPSTFYTVTAAGGGGSTVAADDVSLSVSIDEVTITQGYVIQPDDVSISLSAGVPVVTQGHNLAPDDVSIPVSVSEPTLSQVHIIAPSDVLIPLGVDSPTIGQSGSVSPSDVSIPVSVDSTAIDQLHSISPDNVSLPLSLDEAVVQVAGSISPDDVSLPLILDTLTIVQRHTIPVDDVDLSLQVDSTTVTSAGITVAPADVALSLSVDQSAITQYHVITPDDISIDLLVDVVSLGGLVIGELEGTIYIYAALDGSVKAFPALSGTVH